MKKPSVILIICLCFVAVIIPIAAMAKSYKLPEVTVNGNVISEHEAETVFAMSDHIETTFRGNPSKERSLIFNQLVTQKVIADMFKEYKMEIPAPELQSIENSFSDFYSNYETALANGNEGEIAHLDYLKSVLDAAQKISGLSDAEFEAYNIEQVKITIMSSMLLKEQFNGDKKAMASAIEKYVSSEKVEVKGSNYKFKAVIGIGG